MTWVKLDDRFPEHPKVAQVGAVTAWLHVCGIAYCNRNLTDGRIPRGIVPALTALQGIGFWTGNEWEEADPFELAESLVEENLWEHDGGDFRIHDYDQYQPARADVLAEKKARDGRRISGGKRRAETARRGDDGLFLPNDERTNDDERAGQTSDATNGHQRATSPVSRIPVQDSSLDERLENQTPDSARAEEELPLVDDIGDTAAYLLVKLGRAQQAWAGLVGEPGEVSQLRKLGHDHRGELVMALQQAVDDPTKIRNPGAWLRTTVLAIAREAAQVSATSGDRG
jgi:hypothetical protein